MKNFVPQLQHSDILKDSPEKASMLKLLSTFVLPEKKDFEFGASYGLVTLQAFNQIDIGRLAKGTLRIKFNQKFKLSKF
jgi:hypothetical protein